MGIPILAQEVRDGLTKPKKCKGKKVVSDKTDLDHDYDPSYDIDNQSESDDDCEDDLINEDNIEVAVMAPGACPQNKKQKTTGSQLPPRMPSRMTRQQAATAMPLSRSRAPPRERQPLPPKITMKANPKKTNTVPSPRRHTRQTIVRVIPGANPFIFAPRIPNTSTSTSIPGGNNECTTPTPTAMPGANTEHTTPNLTPNHALFPPKMSPIVTSLLGVQISRQSNDLNESNDQGDGNATVDTSGGQPIGGLVQAPQRNIRKKTIGLGLEKLIKRGNKLVIQVAEGKKRLDDPLQAVKLASETSVALRDKLTIYTSWKLYEKEWGPTEVQKVLDKVANRLEVDVKTDGPSKIACADIIKRCVRQQRYLLKGKYFDESLTMEQILAKGPPPKMRMEEWTSLIEYWCDPNN